MHYLYLLHIHQICHHSRALTSTGKSVVTSTYFVVSKKSHPRFPDVVLDLYVYDSYNNDDISFN